ncbi:MAG: SHOCT domain-containing protein [Actinomycetes bacterium]
MLSGTWCSGMGAGGWILMTVFWVALLAVVVWAVTQPFAKSSESGPLDVLDRRLAAGEIDSETYRQVRAELTGIARPDVRA